MPKSKYEKLREANLKKIQDVFNSMGISTLKENFNTVSLKRKKGKGKQLELQNPESDTDYDPSIDNDNQSDIDDDDDSDDDLSSEVRWIIRCLNKLIVSYIILWMCT
jgi:hypothetical protein